MTVSRAYPHRLLIEKLLPYAVVSVLSLVIAFVVLQLWRITWTIPMYYGAGGDVFGIYSLVKTMTETGWFLNAPDLAAPFGAHWEDFPVPNLLHLLPLRALVLLTSNYAVAVNLYFVALFPLTAMVALYVFRRLGITMITAMALALLFSFLPDRFERQQAHLFYAAYFLAPLIVLVAVWIIREHALFDTTARRPTRDGWIAAATALLVSWDNPYFVLFSGVLFLTGAIVAYVGSRRWVALGSAFGLIVIMGAGLLLAFSPSIAYRQIHGPNTAAIVRYPEASELYALTFIQLVLPIENHRIPALAKLRGYYDTRMAQLVNENSTVSLGVVSACGFVGLLCGFIVIRRRHENALWPDLSRLTLVAFLLSTVGGAGAIFSFYVEPEFRAYNRISPLIAFLGLIAVALALEAGRRWIRWPELQPRYVAILILLTALGIADQTTPAFIPPYEASAARFDADETLARTIEASLPKGSSVFQLPALKYPESPPVQSLGSYDELALYLHTHGIRWSFGGMSGRPEGDWAATIASRPPLEVVATALIDGFSGIAVYQTGYADSGAEIERQISAITGQKPVVEQDGTVAFFAFPGLAQSVSRLLGTDANRIHASIIPQVSPGYGATPSDQVLGRVEKFLAAKTARQQSATNAAGQPASLYLSLRFGTSFYGEESGGGHTWRWASAPTEIIIHNDASRPVKGRLSLIAMGVGAPSATIRVTIKGEKPDTEPLTSTGTHFGISRTFAPGDTPIGFAPSSRPTKIGTDPRTFDFRVTDVTLTR